MRRSLAFGCCFAALTCADAHQKKLIIDTDLFSDVDDAGALLLALTHKDVDVLGVNINYPSLYGGLAASTLLGYYNHSNVPVGVKRPIVNDTYFDDYTFENGEYVSKVAYHWRDNASLPWADASSTWDPVDLYRKLLSEQKNQSVTIASIGFFDNLSGLLSSSADTYSPLSGSELILAKVRELVVMGGAYPSGREYNFFGYNATSTAHVVNHWPGLVTFSGDEVGHYVMSGAELTNKGPEGDPVRAAYLWYNGYNKSRNSWDPLTVLYAIEGLGKIFQFGEQEGHNYVSANGSNEWKLDWDGPPQRYLKLAVTNETAGEILDELYIKGAEKASHY